MATKHQGVMLITGSNSGIGKATAARAAGAGYIVYGGARRSETFADIEAVGARPLLIDVTQEATMVEAVRHIEAQHGAVDVLINNAGFGQMGPIEEVTWEQWQQQYQTNVFGLVRLAQLVIPGMRRRGRGRIVNIGSAGGQFTFPLAGAYHSTKYAVESISDAMRLELRPFGIDVILVQPGPVATPLAQAAAVSLKAAQDSPYSSMIAAFERASQNTMGYLAPEQVSAAIMAAVSAPRPRARYKVGMTAHLMPALHKWLPDRLWDRVVANFYR